MLYNYLRGTVQIEITGGWPERFLSSCAQSGIALWKTDPEGPDRFTAWVSVVDYFRLHAHARRTMTKLRIRKKCGFPFVVHRWMRKKVLWIAAMACVFSIWYLSGFIWTISITGCEQVPQREVLELLEAHGLHFGTRRRSIDGDLLRNDVLQTTDKLSYLVINVQGTHAEVRVTERTPVPDFAAIEEPCDVVADGTGIIQELRVLQGTALVKVGDAIMVGERIASGIVQDAQGGVTKVHAMAEADVLTRREMKAAVPGKTVLYTRTGAQKTRRYFLFGSCKIPLNIIEKDGFAWYDKILEIKSLVLREDFRFDLAIATEIQYECSTVPAELDLNALSSVLQQRMEQSYLAAYPSAQILKRNFRVEEENGVYVGILELESIETIGMMAPLEEET